MINLTDASTLLASLEWYGHASFRLKGSPMIYIDPWRIPRDSTPADAILITHDHYDHCSPTDIEKIRTSKTVIIASPRAANMVAGSTVLHPWQSINVDRACITAVPAYNSHHPDQFEGVGFVVALNHYDIYFAGDTDLIPEMARIHADIAVLPIGGRQTMNVAMAVQAARTVGARYAIPSHWGYMYEGGTSIDARRFVEQVNSFAEGRLPHRVS